MLHKNTFILPKQILNKGKNLNYKDLKELLLIFRFEGPIFHSRYQFESILHVQQSIFTLLNAVKEGDYALQLSWSLFLRKSNFILF